MVGAVLTQNTNWTNVSRAIDTLKNEGLLSFEAISALPLDTLAEKIRPSGYYNLKAKRLTNLLGLIHRKYDGDLSLFFQTDQDTLRQDLLSVKGIGPETADSIILYAAKHPVFVVDAYTHRILSRHGIIGEESDYHEIQDLFMDSLPADTALFNEYHALLVRLGKEFCKKTNPRCSSCPLKEPEE
ncbi:MAG: endonuclease III domain-containing protein [Desulfobulbaceae bacterium]|nr:endonuclease III domain-containing protein [Desulfobulbaceae bacterium]MCK5405494.1 endonuclease III domain-containing protein [Desulfobulbaceae bacterium]